MDEKDFASLEAKLDEVSRVLKSIGLGLFLFGPPTLFLLVEAPADLALRESTWFSAFSLTFACYACWRTSSRPCLGKWLQGRAFSVGAFLAAALAAFLVYRNATFISPWMAGMPILAVAIVLIAISTLWQACDGADDDKIPDHAKGPEEMRGADSKESR